MNQLIVLSKVFVFSLFIVVCLGSVPTLQAQGPDNLPPPVIDFEHITLQDGLVSPFIYDIVQDDKGFIWFSTLKGVSKYDGYQITNYLPDQDDPNAIGAGPAVKMLLDSQGRLWVTVVNNGLYRYNEAGDNFMGYQHDPADPNTLSSNAVYAITEGHDGDIWVSTFDAGLNRLNVEQDTITRYLPDPADPHSLASESPMFVLYTDKQGQLWTAHGVNKMLVVYNPVTEQLKQYVPDPNDPHSIPSTTYREVLEDSYGYIWIATVSGLLRLDPKTDKFKQYSHDPNDPYSLSHNNIRRFIEDQTGTLWVTTWGGGVNVYDRANDRFINYQHDPNASQSLVHNSNWGIFEDRSGVIWVGSYGGGVSSYDRKVERFGQIRNNPNNSNSLSFNDVKAIYEDSQGLLWFGTLGGGLNRYDPANDSYTHYQHDSEQKTSLSHNSIWSIAEENSADLWIATEHGLNRYERDSDSFRPYLHNPDDPDSITGNIVRAVLVTQDDTLWLGHQNGGVSRYERESDTFTFYPTGQYNGSLIEDALGNIWVGTILGLQKYDPSADNFVPYVHDPEDPHSLIDNFVATLYADPDGTLWVGTASGLDHFDPQTETFEHFTTQDGLLNDEVNGILPGDDGTLWISTVLGLSLFNPTAKSFTNYDLQTYNRHSAFKRNNGQLLFGGTQGVTQFWPQDIVSNLNKPEIVVTSFKVFNQEVDLGPAVSSVDSINLSYEDSVFSFDFAALDYSDPQKNRYRYKLEGFDQDWVEVNSDRRFATYTNLDGGDYTFQVLGTNNDQLWNETGVAVKVHIDPPFWETLWFRGGGLILLVGLLFGGFQWRVRSLEANRQALQQQVTEQTAELRQSNKALALAKETAETAQDKAEVANQAKSDFLSSMSHELRTPLNGILGYAQILKRSRNLNSQEGEGLDIIAQSGEHLLTLINDILDLAKVEAGKLDLNPTAFELPSFLRGVTGIIRSRADQKDINFTYEALSPLPNGVLADEKQLRQVLLNLLGNAVKFTDEGHVTLNVTLLETLDMAQGSPGAKIRFEVEDSGVGLSPEELQSIFQPFEQVGDKTRRAEGTGLGLAISRKLIEVMGSTIQVSSHLGQGSTFWFDLTLPTVEAIPTPSWNTARTIIGYKGPSYKILVADDKDYNRLLLVDLLEPLGFELITAQDGQDEVDQAKTKQPDLIITDLVMPLMTGFEAVQKIRQISALQNTVIIATSASVLDNVQQQSKLAGCDVFLPKPIQAQKLFDLLNHYLELEWVYAEVEDDEEQQLSEPQTLIPPPEADLAELFDLAMQGNMDEIEAWAIELEQKDQRYKPFARKLQTLAQNFETRTILTLVKQHRGAK